MESGNLIEIADDKIMKIWGKLMLVSKLGKQARDKGLPRAERYRKLEEKYAVELAEADNKRFEAFSETNVPYGIDSKVGIIIYHLKKGRYYWGEAR